MDYSSSGDFNRQNPNQTANKGLLGSGWRPLYRQFDLNYLWHLFSYDTLELFKKSLDVTSDLADALGRNHYTWWANVLNVFSEDTQYHFNEFWEYITPEPFWPDQRYGRVLTVETPVTQIISRDSIPINYVIERLQEIILFKILEILGKPDLITQHFADRNYYYPVEQFTNWEKLEVLGQVYAFWSKHGGVWLEVQAYQGRKRGYSLLAKEISSLINKATFNLSVLVSGYQNRVGKIQSQYPIRSFPADIQAFTDLVQQLVLTQNQLAVLVQGKPGTGKTAWTQAVAKEILMPLGYVIFILDHDAVENFAPPSYLEKICLIINEADNLAQDRAFEAAQYSNKTEHILSLLDGTLHQSVSDDSGLYQEQKIVILMTCNTTERLDAAFLRKGRVDLIHEFTYQFV
ncbi:AAA family ATPase [Gloeothece verrucosa]|uniref:ATPase AAA-type core domain-containing protein n=1 Tax=Gloeothece verrucosa (strain PCC 7822) TaxID=497965 RepID=E0UJ46_GLOV7|nr:AAA family ATPase [Gloeothece verrucosa]ADN15749.1 conserved hypothetical protein [Gloeothece verrucosa PCC 7822]